MAHRPLRDYALAVAAERFVGRETELAIAAEFLADTAVARVLLVHGPGGIGKSALLREIVRRARRLGYLEVLVDGRALAGVPDPLGEVLDGLDPRHPLVVIDEADALGPGLLGPHGRLFDSVPADARLILAGRAVPDRTWGAGLDDVILELALGPLDDAAARRLLERRGIVDAVSRERIVEWAAGSPLALTVAAQGTPVLGGALPPPDVGDRLVRYLASSEIEGVDVDVLEVAALTWAVDARLIAAALPGRSTRGAIDDLRRLSVVESLGHRVVLHPLLGQAIRERVRRQEPERFRALRRRIADHLTARALDGDARALHELTNLVEDPAVRSGAGLDPSRSHAASAFRPDDAAAIATTPGIARSAWWTAIEPWLTLAPGFVTVVHRISGGVAGLAVYLPASALNGQPGDEGTAAALRHVAEHGLDPARTLVGIAPHTPVPRDAAETAEIIRVANTVMITRTGIVNPRWLLARLWAGSAAPVAFLESLGYRRAPGLRRALGSRNVDTWIADFGPSGLVGLAAGLVAAETGDTSPLPVGEGAHLLSAVRDYLDEAAIARHAPPGTDPGSAAEVARAAVRERVDLAFGPGPEDQRLRRVIELAYLTPDTGERVVLEALHVSRATYYRLLRAARERLVGATAAW